jgi:hypothetical protein
MSNFLGWIILRLPLLVKLLNRILNGRVEVAPVYGFEKTIAFYLVFNWIFQLGVSHALRDQQGREYQAGYQVTRHPGELVMTDCMQSGNPLLDTVNWGWWTNLHRVSAHLRQTRPGSQTTTSTLSSSYLVLPSFSFLPSYPSSGLPFFLSLPSTSSLSSSWYPWLS